MIELDPRHVKMARAIAKTMHRRVPRNVERDDLEQAALMGLLDALTRHPGGVGPAWEWYLRCRMRGAVIDELRREDWATRRQRGGLEARPRIYGFDDLRDAIGEPRQYATDEPSPEETAITRLDAAKAWTAPMPARSLRMMRASVEGGRRHVDIGAAEGVSEARVSQLMARGYVRMREHLTAGDPEPLPPPQVAPWKRRLAP